MNIEGRGFVHPAALVGVGLLLLAPLAIYPVFLMKVMCFSLFACAVNLLLGYVGLLSFGHCMFFGLSAYLAGHGLKHWGWQPELAIFAAVGGSVILGLIAGSVAIRRQGIYFGMITLALAQMVYFICLQAQFTGGEDGLQNVPRSPLLGIIDISSDTGLYVLVMAIFLFGFCVYHRSIHSPFGQVLKAIKDNEARAVSLGYHVQRYKLAAFTIAAGLAGLAGATKVLVLQLASLTDVNWHISAEVILMTLIGGVGTVVGPVAGAAIVLGLQEFLAPLGEWVLVIQGVAFAAVVMAFRSGVVGSVASWRTRRAVSADPALSFVEPSLARLRRE